LGNVARGRREFDRALARYRAALAIRKDLLRADPEDTKAIRDLAVNHAALGDTLARVGRSADAATHFEQSLQVRLRLGDARLNNADDRKLLAELRGKIAAMTASPR